MQTLADTHLFTVQCLQGSQQSIAMAFSCNVSVIWSMVVGCHLPQPLGNF